MTSGPRRSGYRNYTTSGQYWTVRKRGSVYWVVLIDPSSGSYVWTNIWGGYNSPGAAGGAAAQLAYAQGKQDAVVQIRETLHATLDDVGLGVPSPTPPQVNRSHAPDLAVEDGAQDEDEAEDDV